MTTTRHIDDVRINALITQDHMVSYSVVRYVFADLLQNVQLMFLMLTKPDRKEGQQGGRTELGRSCVRWGR